MCVPAINVKYSQPSLRFKGSNWIGLGFVGEETLFGVKRKVGNCAHSGTVRRQSGLTSRIMRSGFIAQTLIVFC